MESYQNMLNRACSIISGKTLEYRNTIIIGDNSSGKSDVLKRLIQNDEDEEFYFIDAVNRYFDIGQIMKQDITDIIYSNKINKQRLEEDTFNQKDTFYYKGVPTTLEVFYLVYKAQTDALMSDFLQCTFTICQDEVGWNVCVNDKIIDLSSGYQALIRLFLEILYYYNTNGQGTIVIDEIDEFLSPKNSGKILEFLKEKFTELDFIVTTHSADLIANAKESNLILLKDSQFEVLDAGDFSSITQVYDIFCSFFEKKEQTEKQKNDEMLRRLFNNKMSGIWEKVDNDELNEIRRKQLTKAQKLIVRQIEEWKN